MTGQGEEFLKSGGLLNAEQRAAFIAELKKPCSFCGGPLGSCEMCGAEEEEQHDHPHR